MAAECTRCASCGRTVEDELVHSTPIEPVRLPGPSAFTPEWHADMAKLIGILLDLYRDDADRRYHRKPERDTIRRHLRSVA